PRAAMRAGGAGRAPVTATRGRGRRTARGSARRPARRAAARHARRRSGWRTQASAPRRPRRGRRPQRLHRAPVRRGGPSTAPLHGTYENGRCPSGPVACLARFAAETDLVCRDAAERFGLRLDEAEPVLELRYAELELVPLLARH